MSVYLESEQIMHTEEASSDISPTTDLDQLETELIIGIRRIRKLLSGFSKDGNTTLESDTTSNETARQQAAELLKRVETEYSLYLGQPQNVNSLSTAIVLLNELQVTLDSTK